MSRASPDRLIEVGRVAGAFGVRGEIRITTFTEDPLALLRYRALRRQDGSEGLTITAARPAKGGVVARAAQVATKEEADRLRGLRLYVPRSSLPATEEDEFYLADLIGLTAYDAAGALIGRVKSVQNFGAGDLLEIAPPDGAESWWAPFTREVAPEIDLDGGRLTVIRPVETLAGKGPAEPL